jgi:hypothetical protein
MVSTRRSDARFLLSIERALLIRFKLTGGLANLTGGHTVSYRLVQKNGSLCHGSVAELSRVENVINTIENLPLAFYIFHFTSWPTLSCESSIFGLLWGVKVTNVWIFPSGLFLAPSHTCAVAHFLRGCNESWIRSKVGSAPAERSVPFHHRKFYPLLDNQLRTCTRTRNRNGGSLSLPHSATISLIIRWYHQSGS